MQIIFLDLMQTLILDVIVWAVLHLSIGYISSKIPLEQININHWFFQTFKWEKDGTIYDKWLKVKSWKKYIPNGSALYKGSFSIRRLQTFDMEYLTRWLKESIRAEICHWAMTFPCTLFFLWNNVVLGWLMVAYAFLNNLVPIVAQRFNRPRVRRMLEIAREREQKSFKPEANLMCPSNNMSPG